MNTETVIAFIAVLLGLKGIGAVGRIFFKNEGKTLRVDVESPDKRSWRIFFFGDGKD